jgi:hypothetical protein
MNDKWNTETKNRLLQAELQKLKTKHDNENNAMKLKMELTLNEFNIKRKNEFQKYFKKNLFFKNKYY